MVIYVIGPSAVGKTTHCAYAARQRSDIGHVDLDKECDGFQFDWTRVQRKIRDIHEGDDGQQVKLVDVGAGIQTLDPFRSHIEDSSAKVILVYGSPEVVLPRNRAKLGAPRPMENFRQVEYLSRKRLYSIAHITIETDAVSTQEANEVFLRALRRLEKK